MKQLIILVGLKGSGKTYIGTLVQKELGIKFLRAEDIWLTLKSNKLSDEYIMKGFELVEYEIDNMLLGLDRIITESTGITEYFNVFLKSLRSKYDVKLVKIKASTDTCFKRVKSRDESIHIPISDNKLEAINKEAVKVNLEFDLVIDNEKSSDKKILEKLRKIL